MGELVVQLATNCDRCEDPTAVAVICCALCEAYLCERHAVNPHEAADRVQGQPWSWLCDGRTRTLNDLARKIDGLPLVTDARVWPVCPRCRFRLDEPGDPSTCGCPPVPEEA